MTAKDLPTPATLRKLLSYDPNTGLLTWKRRSPEMFKAENRSNAWNARHAGKEAFTATMAQGYKIGSVLGSVYYAHRVAYAVHYGKWPAQHIDHISGDAADNRITNLRDVSQSMNCRNTAMQSSNTSGVCGVSWHKGSGKWQAHVKLYGKQKYLGTFDNIDDAAAARKAAEAGHGFTERHGT